MYSSRSYSYSSPRTFTYTSPTSRYTAAGSSLPPLSSRYTSSTPLSTTLPRKRYTSPSVNRSSSGLPPVSRTSSTYFSASTLPSDQKWRSSTVTSDRSYLSRRPSYLSGLNYRSDSLTSLTSYSPSANTEERKPPTTYDSSDYEPIKRSSASYRNYSTTSSSDADKLAEGVGLINLGNTCFMNAVLQCLCHTQPLVNYCNMGLFNSDINYKSPTRGELIKAFAGLVKVMWRDGTSYTANPDHIKRELQKHSPRFAGYNQQDAQELLRCLLHGLHNDINKAKVKTVSLSTNEHLSEVQHARESWNRYKTVDDSKIVDIFGGQLKSTLKCEECKNKSITFDPFWDLSLPIPEGTRHPTLDQCFRLFTAPEVLHGLEKPMCEKCKKKTRSTKQFEVHKLPTVLVIHLKRFSSGRNYQSKIDVFVDCPENIDLSMYAASNCSAASTCYNLYGVVDHYGSSSSGHYTAKCRNFNTGEWSEFNDTRVCKISPSSLITAKAYILFYEQGRRYSRL